MVESSPLVSVNICTHNRQDLIEKSIRSIIEQDYQNIEVVVSDSGNDKTQEIIEKIQKENPNLKIKYFKNNTSGISENRNFALSKSSGKYIAVLDSDDYWISTNKISNQVTFLEKNSDYALVGTNAVIVDDVDKKIGEIINKTSDSEIRQNFLLKNQFVHSSVLFRKDNFRGYDENIFIWEDYNSFLELAKKYKVANLPDKAMAYKKHQHNISNKNKIKNIQTLRKILKANKDCYPNYIPAQLKNYLRLIKTLLGL